MNLNDVKVLIIISYCLIVFIFIIKDVMCVEYCKYMESIVSMNQEVCFFLYDNGINELWLDIQAVSRETDICKEE